MWHELREDSSSLWHPSWGGRDGRKYSKKIHGHQNISDKAVCVPCGFIVSPTTLRRMISTQKGECMYVLCERKKEGARGHNVLTAKYSHTHTCIRHLSENRSGHPQYHQNISEAKYFGTSSREKFHVLFILKKSSILNVWLHVTSFGLIGSIREPILQLYQTLWYDDGHPRVGVFSQHLKRVLARKFALDMFINLSLRALSILSFMISHFIDIVPFSLAPPPPTFHLSDYRSSFFRLTGYY